MRHFTLLMILFSLACLGQYRWDFNGDLTEASGKCPFYCKDQLSFAVVDGRHCAKLEQMHMLTTNYAPANRLDPGFSFACAVRVDKHTQQGWSTIVSKGKVSQPGGFFLRLDNADEGVKFSWFVNFDGRPEPRVSVREVPFKLGEWYELEGGWDGENIWLTVNGITQRVRRTGFKVNNLEPLTIGSFDGYIDYLRLGDKVKADNQLAGKKLEALEEGPLQTSFGKVGVTGAYSETETLHIRPGSRLSGVVRFDQITKGEHAIAFKDREYLLRYDRGENHGAFNFFVFLNDKWEPRARCQMDVETGKDYCIFAGWDGLKSHIQVNGKTESINREGFTEKTPGNFMVGSFPGTVRDLCIENHEAPLPVINDLVVSDMFPKAKTPFTLSGKLCNYGIAMEDCVVVVDPPKDITVKPLVHNVGTLPANGELALSWEVSAEEAASGTMRGYVKSGKQTIGSFSKRLYFSPQVELDRSAKAWQPVVKETKAYYIDAIGGSNANNGLTPATAWRDFTNINGKTLGAGERLLLKRGSVFNQELKVTAQGAPDNYAEIGAYGEGARPTIRRNRDINDRCILISTPSYLVIRDLIVCNAGKGLNVEFTREGKGLLIENVLAHHIEGLYRFNAHGIPEWRDQRGAPGGSNGGIAISGHMPVDAVIRDCETYQCSVGWRANGKNIFLDRIFCHDNYSHNTSPHPVLSGSYNSYLVNCIFDASGWNASAGTMGIMLGPNYGLVIRNCHFLNQPDSGSHDEGGIDFEAGGEANLIHKCTFRNNAGAAIEVLGLRSPQTKNVDIRQCRFDRNNTATKLGPSEIFIWGGSSDKNIVCSTGIIRENGYVLLPGIDFFANKAKPGMTDWTLEDNRQFETFEELDKAMPYNNPPIPNPGPEIWTNNPENVILNGQVTDDGRPANGKLAVQWEQLEGQVLFANPSQPATTATFPAVGDYRLMLKADDGELWRSARTAVHVLPPGTQVAKAWDFSKNLDKEGWTDAELGTVKEIFPGAQPHTGTFANPVNLVCGDFYVMAIKDSKSAHILSPDKLDAQANTFAIKFQNHTNARKMKLSYTTIDEPDFKDAKTSTFDVIPNDLNDTLYHIPLQAKSPIKQMRLDFSGDGKPITGTCRIDYIWLGNR
jgi:hypothetical protein